MGAQNKSAARAVPIEIPYKMLKVFDQPPFSYSMHKSVSVDKSMILKSVSASQSNISFQDLNTEYGIP